MKIDDGKIVEATESELFDRWLSCDHCEIYPFDYYKWLCQEEGMKIVEDVKERKRWLGESTEAVLRKGKEVIRMSSCKKGKGGCKGASKGGKKCGK